MSQREFSPKGMWRMSLYVTTAGECIAYAFPLFGRKENGIRLIALNLNVIVIVGGVTSRGQR